MNGAATSPAYIMMVARAYKAWPLFEDGEIPEGVELMRNECRIETGFYGRHNDDLIAAGVVELPGEVEFQLCHEPDLDICDDLQIFGTDVTREQWSEARSRIDAHRLSQET